MATRIEIPDVKTLAYRQVSANGVSSTEIQIEDVDGCKHVIVLHHDGRARLRKLPNRKS